MTAVDGFIPRVGIAVFGIADEGRSLVVDLQVDDEQVGVITLEIAGVLRSLQQRGQPWEPYALNGVVAPGASAFDELPASLELFDEVQRPWYLDLRSIGSKLAALPWEAALVSWGLADIRGRIPALPAIAGERVRSHVLLVIQPSLAADESGAVYRLPVYLQQLRQIAPWDGDDQPLPVVSVVLSQQQADLVLDELDGPIRDLWNELNDGKTVGHVLADDAWTGPSIASVLRAPVDELYVIDDWSREPVEVLAESVAELADLVGAPGVVLRQLPGWYGPVVGVADRIDGMRPGRVRVGSTQYVHPPGTDRTIEVPDPWGGGEADSVARAAARRRWESLWVGAQTPHGATAEAMRRGLDAAGEALARVAAASGEIEERTDG